MKYFLINIYFPDSSGNLLITKTANQDLQRIQFLVIVQLRSEGPVSRESTKLILSIAIILLVVGLGVYLQEINAPVYGIPGLLEPFIKK